MECLLHRHEHQQLTQKDVADSRKWSGAGKIDAKRHTKDKDVKLALQKEANEKIKKTKGKSLELNSTLATIAHLFSRSEKNAGMTYQNSLSYIKRDIVIKETCLVKGRTNTQLLRTRLALGGNCRRAPKARAVQTRLLADFWSGDLYAAAGRGQPLEEFFEGPGRSSLKSAFL